jgi:ribosomal protein S18 acetylase RimI-like enzyme
MMTDENELNIRTVINSDRSRVANLIHFGTYVHQHLDWRSPLEWIGRQPYLGIENSEGFMATLACPQEIPEITWIRLFAVRSNNKVDKVWRALWDAACDELSQKGKIQIAALSMQNWFTDILEKSKFIHTDNVIVLKYEKNTVIQLPYLKSIVIRHMLPEDFPFVLGIDGSAFKAEWRNSLEEMELAYQLSSYATIAEMNHEIVGYQYSTSSGMGGHLARLAVRDNMQGQGIGYSLVHDVVRHFRQHGVMNLSVNTQQSNIASLGLYSKSGFKSTGESYRVYHFNM